MKKPLIHIVKKDNKIISVIEGESDVEIAEMLHDTMKRDPVLFTIIQHAFAFFVLDRLNGDPEHETKRSDIV